jgi:Transposase DDE domain group 1
MPTECNAEAVRSELFELGPVEGRAVVAGFDGGAITSDAGALLLGTADRAIGLVGRFAECFIDRRRPELVEHLVPTLVADIRDCARLRGPQRPRRAAARSGDGGTGG